MCLKHHYHTQNPNQRNSFPENDPFFLNIIFTFQGCNQLTDRSLEAVKSHCQKLKFLDVQGCRFMSPELACAMGCLPTLHTVLMSKPGPYITDGLKDRSTAPAFLPALMRKFRLH